eukprot:143322-Alexandrium_andersonii.AAC.1
MTSRGRSWCAASGSARASADQRELPPVAEGRARCGGGPRRQGCPSWLQPRQGRPAPPRWEEAPSCGGR